MVVYGLKQPKINPSIYSSGGMTVGETYRMHTWYGKVEGFINANRVVLRDVDGSNHTFIADPAFFKRNAQLFHGGING